MRKGRLRSCSLLFPNFVSHPTFLYLGRLDINKCSDTQRRVIYGQVFNPGTQIEYTPIQNTLTSHLQYKVNFPIEDQFIGPWKSKRKPLIFHLYFRQHLHALDTNKAMWA